MNAIKKLIVGIIVIIAILGVAIIGGYIYVRSVYGIDLFRTAGQLKTLSAEVNEKELCPNAYTSEDFVGVKNATNAEIDGFIKNEEGKGYQGYSVDFSALKGKTLTKSISISERQAGALAQTVFFGQTGGKIKIGEKEVPVTVVQTDFSEIAENGSADFNVVVKFDLTVFKADMGKFPYKYFKKYIPDYMYVSSTVRVEKAASDGFGYSVLHRGFTLNNLDKEETADLFRTLDTVLKIGSAEDLNKQIGTVAVNALIGTKDNPGFAYSIKAIGAKNFMFATSADADRFIVN